MSKNKEPNYKCDGCGKPIYVQPYRMKKQKYKFCNYECYRENIGKYFKGKNNSNYNHKKYKCDWCGKIFERIPSEIKGKHKYCSHECYLEVNRRKERKAEIVVTCNYCGKSFKKYRSQIKDNKRNYCSDECRNKGWGLYYSGENSPKWNPDLTYSERLNNRKYQEYYNWRESVYKRDNYTCRKCGDNSGGNLNAHHIYNYMEYKKLRTKVENGITLCNECHKKFHDTYGYTGNNKEQIKQFLR